MNLILLLAAVVCFAIATLLGFDVFSGSHWDGWTALGLTLLAAAHLVGERWFPIRRE